MPFCRKCGNELTNEDLFCDQCGQVVPKIVAQATKAIQDQKESIPRSNPATVKPNIRTKNKTAAEITLERKAKVHTRKTCPFCGQTVSTSDEYCKKCGHDMSVQTIDRKKMCPVCGRHMLDTEQICRECGHDITKKPSNVLWYLHDTSIFLAIACVVLCLFPIVTIGGWFSKEETCSILKLCELCFNFDYPEYNTIGFLSVMLVAFPIAIAIVMFNAKWKSYNSQGHGIACSIIGALYVYCLYQLKETFESSYIGYFGDVTGIHTVLLLAGIAITVLAFTSIFIKR